ncbi:Mediator of RNA polymerase II transcription subunit 37f [Diplonema papillatum]|nr:Mediator of RNA polymerase II transcription subunit 37f [Diplonema papillatum]
MKFEQQPSVGLVVGDTNACCALWESTGGTVDTVVNARGDRVTPAVAFYHSAVSSQPPQVFVGEDALAREARAPGGLIEGLKCFVGLSPQDIDTDARLLQNRGITADTTNTKLVQHVRIGTAPSTIPVERLLTVLATAFRERVEFLLGDKKVRQFVVAAPPYYTLQQRSVVSRCLVQAGASAVYVVADALAAVVGSGLHKRASPGDVVVVDIGGSSVTVTVVKAGDDGGLRVAAVGGDVRVGSKSINAAMLEELKARHQDRTGREMTPKQQKKYAGAIESVKRHGKGEVDVELQEEDDEIEVSFSSAKLLDLAKPVLDAVTAAIDEAVGAAGVSATQCAAVLMVGGGARLAHAQACVQQKFPAADVLVGGAAPPEEAVALGAAAIAGNACRAAAAAAANSDAFDEFLNLPPAFLAVEPADGSRRSSLPPVPPPSQGTVHHVAVSDEKLRCSLGVVVINNKHDVMVNAGAQLPVCESRYFACPTPQVLVTVVEFPPGGDQRQVGSFVAAIAPPASLNEPNVCVRLSVAPSGALEVSVVDVSGPSDVSHASVGLLRKVPAGIAAAKTTAVSAASANNTTLTTPRQTAATPPIHPMQPTPGTPARYTGSQQQDTSPTSSYSGTASGLFTQGGFGASLMNRSASMSAADPKPAAVTVESGREPPAGVPPEEWTPEQLEERLTDLNDRFQAVEWFLQAKSLVAQYPVPEGKLGAVEEAMREADVVTQSGTATGPQIQQLLDKLNAVCSFPVGAAQQQYPLMRIALGMWQFAVAPQDDDTQLLGDALKAGTPVAHPLGATGNTVLHEIALYGALKCLAKLSSHVGPQQMKQLLALRNASEVTPLEVAALNNKLEMSQALSACLT